jgi:zinc protease
MNRAIPPSIEHNSTYQPMIPALHVTAKGIRLYCIEDHTQPLAFFSLTLRMGYTEGQPGLGYFASKMLTRGTHNSTAQHIADTIETWGGSLYTSIERDIMTISINILSRYFNDAVRLMAECVMQPAFQQYESDKLKIKIYADIERTENDPQAIAFKAAESRLYAGHPYEVQWYGSKKAIQDIQPEHCHQWHNDILSRNGFFVAAGDIQPEAVLNAIDELFPQLNAVEVNKNNSTPLTNPSHNRIIAIHRNNSLQSTIITGLHVPGKHHPDFIALRLLTAVLGGEGLSTRLTMALREEKAYTYGAGCFIDDALQGAALFCLTSVGNEVTEDAIQEIFKQIRRLHHEPIPDEELERQKQSIIGKTLFSAETPKQRAYLAQFCEIHGVPLTYFQQRNEIIRTIQPDFLLSIAQTYLTPEKMTIAVCGDGEILNEQLKNFGAIEML